MNNFIIDTCYGVNTIRQTLTCDSNEGLTGKISDEIMSLKGDAIRSALIRSGWTPPREWVEVKLPLGWTGYYTRNGGTTWFWCTVVGHDEGKVVVRTKSGYYHAHDPNKFEFAKSLTEGIPQ